VVYGGVKQEKRPKNSARSSRICTQYAAAAASSKTKKKKKRSKKGLRAVLGTQGATGKKMGKKISQCTYVLYLARIELLYTYDDAIFFIAFLSSPHRETPKNALKKIGEGGKKLDARPHKTFLSRF
jgi:hypothetical protein